MLDLHYSHKNIKVLAFMKANNLLSLYIPAGCTDVMQTCDTVANKPFKVKAEGRISGLSLRGTWEVDRTIS